MIKKLASFAVAIAASVNICAADVYAKGSTDSGPTLTAYFNSAKKNNAELIAFLHKMPKGADLHNHLSATIEAEDIVKAAIEQNMWFDRTDKKFVAAGANEEGHKYYETKDFDPVRNIDTGSREAIYTEILNAISMRDYKLGNEDGHDHFFESFFRFSGVNIKADLIYEKLFERAYSEKICYIELMKNPKEDDIDAVKKYNEIYNKKSPPLDIDINFIATVNRNTPMDNFEDDKGKTKTGFEKNFDEALELYDKNIGKDGPKVVGITLLSAEDDPVSQANFDAQMKYIDSKFDEYKKAKKPFPKMHIHGGELTLEYATFSSMLNRISKTIDSGHANIIGHGTSIAWEDDVYGLLKKMRDKKIGVSICPTSNETILNVYGPDHPFKLYWDADVPIAIATDDEGLSRSNLTNEYAKIAKWFDLSYNEIKWLSINSLEMSFLDGEGIFSDHDYNKLKENWKDLVKKSAKAKKEKQLLDMFNVFENEMPDKIDSLFR
jgi:adenosine deaminase